MPEWPKWRRQGREVAKLVSWANMGSWLAVCSGSSRIRHRISIRHGGPAEQADDTKAIHHMTRTIDVRRFIHINHGAHMAKALRPCISHNSNAVAAILRQLWSGSSATRLRCSISLLTWTGSGHRRTYGRVHWFCNSGRRGFSARSEPSLTGRSSSRVPRCRRRFPDRSSSERNNHRRI